MSKQMDFLVKLRDGAQLIADAASEYLETLAPTELKSQRPESWSDKVWTWDPQRLVWVQAQGDKGAYERADAEHNPSSIDFDNLIKDLQQHKDSLTRNGLYYWKFTTGQIVGRKSSTKRF